MLYPAHVGKYRCNRIMVKVASHLYYFVIFYVDVVLLAHQPWGPWFDPSLRVVFQETMLYLVVIV